MEKRIVLFDFLRVVAMISIVLYHYTKRYCELVESTDFLFYVPSTIATCAVSVFLCLTGYFSYSNLINHKKAIDYLWKRLKRLIPTFWICLSITTIVLIVSGRNSISPTQFILNALLVNRFFGVPSIDGAYWYMMILMLFTLNMVILIMLKDRMKNVLFAIYGILITLVGVINYIVPFVPELVVWALFKYINKCYFGLVLAYVFDNMNSNMSKAICLIYGIVVMISEGLWVDTERFIPDVIASIVFGIVVLLSKKSKIVEMKIKPICILSGCSYFLYLIHEEVGFTLISLLINININPNISLTITILVMIAISLLYFYLEKSIINSLKNKKTRNKYEC